jgi:hypothetical protein
MEKSNLPANIEKSKEKFELALKEINRTDMINNITGAFAAVIVVKTLRDAMTDEVMKEVFMPLMNTKIGFLTDRNGKPNSKGETKPLYSIDVVRDSVIDAVSMGLLPTGNQFNIIAERMYPTKEGYTFLLKKLACKYFLEIGADNNSSQTFAVIPVKLNYEFLGAKNSFVANISVKKDTYSSPDQLRGKAEKRAKKILYEYLTGIDLGETSDEIENNTIDAKATVINTPENVQLRKSGQAPDSTENQQSLKL